MNRAPGNSASSSYPAVLRDATVLTRRELLAGSGALATALAARQRAQAADRPLLPRELLFGDPDVTWARLSPEGTFIAYVAPVDGVRNLWLAPVGDVQAARPITRVTGRPIGGYFRWAFTERHIVFFQDRAGDENWRASSVDITDGRIVPLTPERGVRAYVQAVSHRYPREMLLAHNERDKRFSDLYRIDVVSGRSERIFENREFAWLVTDSRFGLRCGARYLQDGSLEWLERRPDGVWALLFSIPIG